MAGVNVKMSVTGAASFKQSINESKEAVKTLNEALKANESQLKLTGDQEAYAERQAGLLKQQIEAQKKIFDDTTAALEAMRQSGVDPSSKSFQQMQRDALQAQRQLNDMQVKLRDVENGAEGATKDTDAMNDELERIGKNVSWQNVTDGIQSIVSTLESGARAAVNFGKKMLRYVSDSAEWADQLLELSTETGYSVEQLQKMENVAEIVDTSVDAIITARSRMMNATGKAGGKNAIEEILGVSLNGQDPDDLMWEIGDALMGMTDAYEQEQAAQAIFGRSWRELLPLFKTGRDAYEQMLEEQNVLSEQDVKKLGEVDDKLTSVEQEMERIKNQFIADNAETILTLLQWFSDNYQSIVEGLIAIGAALTAMKIGEFALNLAKAIEGFRTLGFLGGAGAGGGGGSSPTIVPTGGGNGTGNGGGTYGGLLNTLTLAAVAKSVSDAIYGPLEETREDFERMTEGMSNEAKSRIAGAQTLGLTLEEYDALMGYNAPNKVPEGNTAYVGVTGPTVRRNRFTGEVESDYGSAMERMAMVAGSAIKASANSLTSSDLAQFTGLPGEIARAVENANIKVYIDGSLAGQTLAPHIGAVMGTMVAGMVRP